MCSLYLQRPNILIQRERVALTHMSQSSSREESPESGTEKLRDVPSILDKTGPLLSSYTYHSPTPTAVGPYILGVDEAGRGPVLGPLVYGVAYCPVVYREQLNDLGFAGTIFLQGAAPALYSHSRCVIDSKTLTSDTRASLLNTLSGDVANLGWSVRVLRFVSLPSSGTIPNKISYAALGTFQAVCFADVQSI
jgi:hypothetical protein